MVHSEKKTYGLLDAPRLGRYKKMNLDDETSLDDYVSKFWRKEIRFAPACVTKESDRKN